MLLPCARAALIDVEADHPPSPREALEPQSRAVLYAHDAVVQTPACAYRDNRQRPPRPGDFNPDVRCSSSGLHPRNVRIDAGVRLSKRVRSATRKVIVDRGLFALRVQEQRVVDVSNQRAHALSLTSEPSPLSFGQLVEGNRRVSLDAPARLFHRRGRRRRLRRRLTFFGLTRRGELSNDRDRETRKRDSPST
jgi:hypothetical protein